MPSCMRTLLERYNGRIRLLEAHDHISREIVSTVTGDEGESFQGIWISSLTQTTYLGVPDTELISPLERASSLKWLRHQPQHQSRSRLCVAYDADNGGSPPEIPSLVAKLSSLGVSMIVIEDKSVNGPGQKVNSLAQTSSSQRQADMYSFAEKIQAFVTASIATDMVVAARIESFTVRAVKADPEEERLSVRDALEDAFRRAECYKKAGAGAIMIHSKRPDPGEVLRFLKEFRLRDPSTPLIVVPTTFGNTPEDTFYNAGANILIYANHLMRAKIHASSKFSKVFLGEAPGVFMHDADLWSCFANRNFGCLLRKLKQGENLDDEAVRYLEGAQEDAVKNMVAVAKHLVVGDMSDVVDKRLISVQDLLEINSRQVTVTKGLFDNMTEEQQS